MLVMEKPMRESTSLREIFTEIMYSAHITDVTRAITTPVMVLVVVKFSLKTSTPVTPIIDRTVPSQKRLLLSRGLSSAKKIIEKHEGDVKAFNSTDGLEIRIRLPLEK